MPTALVIESDLFFSVRIEKTLQKMGYAVKVTTTGEQALAEAAASPPDIVILNFGEERLHAEETTRKLKDAHHAALVLGHVSHVNMPFVRPNAIHAGCDLLVANSALTMRLPQLVEKLLGRQTNDTQETAENESAGD